MLRQNKILGFLYSTVAVDKILPEDIWLACAIKREIGKIWIWTQFNAVPIAKVDP